MPDFGNAGTRTVRKSMAGLEVDISKGEHLLYSVTVEGAEGAFVFVCKHQTLLKSTDFPDHPKQVYEWEWPSGTLNSDNSDDRYGVRVSFISAVKYTLLVEHRSSNGSVIAIVKDIDYESQDPNDWYQEGLRVLS